MCREVFTITTEVGCFREDFFIKSGSLLPALGAKSKHEQVSRITQSRALTTFFLGVPFSSSSLICSKGLFLEDNGSVIAEVMEPQVRGIP